ncbi:serine protease, partial [Rhodococcus sp. HM1]|nr:serine protease [Rhodococcus sp. HM1]
MERPADAPRLEPRPVYRPAVDPAAARVFGRPSGTAGSFTDAARARAAEPPVAHVPPADPVLAPP